MGEEIIYYINRISSAITSIHDRYNFLKEHEPPYSFNESSAHVEKMLSVHNMYLKKIKLLPEMTKNLEQLVSAFQNNDGNIVPLLIEIDNLVNSDDYKKKDHYEAIVKNNQIASTSFSDEKHCFDFWNDTMTLLFGEIDSILFYTECIREILEYDM